MNDRPLIRLLVAAVATLSLCGCATESYRELIERKHESPLQWFQVISYSPTTKVLWFDWERKWWGSFDVVETNSDGSPRYWYDVDVSPSAQSIESIRVVTLSGEKYLEVIDCTHMGNGMLYLYQIKAGAVSLKLKARVIANLSVQFEPRVAQIEYRDVDGNGKDDVIVSSTVTRKQRSNSQKRIGNYHREFHYKDGVFQEAKERRQGNDMLMDEN